MPDNHYEVLGVPPTADLDTIKRAYRDKIRRFHPDRFAAERAALQRAGDSAALRALERRSSEAQRQTQRINASYAILSDKERRQQYDRQLAAQRATSTAATYNRATQEPRTTQKTRPHSARPSSRPAQPAKESAAPWAWIAGLVVILLLVFGFISNFLGSTAQNAERARVTPATRVPVGSTDATATARASGPVVTQNAETFADAGDVLMQRNSYELALDAYTSAVAVEPGNVDLLVRRAAAWVEWAEAEDIPAHLEQALQDLGQAIQIAPEDASLYRIRGLLHFDIWRDTRSPEAAESARRDLNQYLELHTGTGEPDADVNAALLQLDLGGA